MEVHPNKIGTTEMFASAQRCLREVFSGYEIYYWGFVTFLWFCFFKLKGLHITASYWFDDTFDPLSRPIDYLFFTMLIAFLGYIMSLLQVKSQEHCSKIKERLMSMLTELEILCLVLIRHSETSYINELINFPNEFRAELALKPKGNKALEKITALSAEFRKKTKHEHIIEQFNRFYRLGDEVLNIETGHIYEPLLIFLMFGVYMILTGISPMFWSRLGFIFGTIASFTIVVILVGFVDLARSRNGFNEIIGDDCKVTVGKDTWIGRWDEKVLLLNKNKTNV